MLLAWLIALQLSDIMVARLIRLLGGTGKMRSTLRCTHRNGLGVPSDREGMCDRTHRHTLLSYS
ncbi:hypothetical protein QT979_01355 [Microcoleus sp. w2-18bC1]|uniref:hypothetical protein n=1 Tax=unclassified Microcoleus TaxID=2642155 RepID=UPI002FCFFF4F